MSDRHEKWVRVEPGHVIPAGQPYRIEWESRGDDPAAEEHHGSKQAWTVEIYSSDSGTVFVDSSWRPPLNLPEKPTWGIAVYGACHTWTERLYLDLDGKDLRGSIRGGNVRASEIVDFIPLTDEQVARIEAAR